MGRIFDFITAEAKRIEAALKVMFKLVFVKIAQAQRNLVNSLIPLGL